MKEFFRRIADWFGLFPCPICRKNSGRGRNEICPECRKQLSFLPTKDRCRSCGGRSDSALAVCSGCMHFPPAPHIDAVAVLEYCGTARTLIRQMKFGNRPELARPLALLAVEKLRESRLEFDVIVPVPLHWQRFLLRSYNQTELLSAVIAAETGKPVIKAVKKILPTPHQSRLKKSQRLKNLKNTFAVKNASFAGKNVLLVDDVITTGATVSAVAKVLMKNGAESVRVLCCARTPLKVKISR